MLAWQWRKVGEHDGYEPLAQGAGADPPRRVLSSLRRGGLPRQAAFVRSTLVDAQWPQRLGAALLQRVLVQLEVAFTAAVPAALRPRGDVGP